LLVRRTCSLAPAVTGGPFPASLCWWPLRTMPRGLPVHPFYLFVVRISHCGPYGDTRRHNYLGGAHLSRAQCAKIPFHRFCATFARRHTRDFTLSLFPLFIACPRRSFFSRLSNSFTGVSPPLRDLFPSLSVLLAELYGGTFKPNFLGISCLSWCVFFASFLAFISFSTMFLTPRIIIFVCDFPFRILFSLYTLLLVMGFEPHPHSGLLFQIYFFFCFRSPPSDRASLNALFPTTRNVTLSYFLKSDAAPPCTPFF